jgi:hypothetical protein
VTTLTALVATKMRINHSSGIPFILSILPQAQAMTLSVPPYPGWGFHSHPTYYHDRQNRQPR